MHPYDVAILAVEAKVLEQVPKQFTRIALRLKQEGAVHIAFPAFEQLEKKRRLAHPRLGHKRQKSTTRLDSIEKRRKRFSMTRAEIQEARVRSHAERLLSQAVEVEEHR